MCLFLLCRYVELKYESSSIYRRYESSVPGFLHDRPRSFVTHCLEKISLSSEICDENALLVDETLSLFSVARTRCCKETYEVHFTIPRFYNCPAFSSTHLPCKHFFAVMRVFPRFTWDSLPEYYRCSPFITLDFDAVFEQENIKP